MRPVAATHGGRTVQLIGADMQWVKGCELVLAQQYPTVDAPLLLLPHLIGARRPPPLPSLRCATRLRGLRAARP